MSRRLPRFGIIFFLLVSKLVLTVFMKVYYFIVKIVKGILHILWLPIKLILKPITFIIRKLHKLLKKNWENG